MHSSLIVLIVILLNIQSLVQTSQQFVFHCNPNPCLNGGECIVHHNNTSNSNRNTHRLTTHHCRCPHSHVGSRCQFVSPCFQQNRCLNGGTCHTIPGARDTALETQPGFRCACALGFSASLCEIAIPSACDSSPCAHNGRCVLTADLDHYRCDCALGWRGHTCEQRDNCVSSPCKNAATCVSRDHGFECVCASGFTGHTCTADVDECHEVWTSSGGDACSANGVCINTMGSFRCVCERGFTGARCDTRYVPCSANPCLNAGSCVPHFASLSYSCVCRVGFTGRDCDTNVDDCGGNLCQNGATCVDGLNTYTCSCPESHATGLAQWSGPYCSRDVDECSLRPHVCSNGATCVNTLGSFQCICVNGWTGVTCDTNIDDCAAAACFNGATCHDRIASFYCECPPGKTGLLCHLDDACASNPCHAGAICDTSPVDGTYVCSCRPGFKGVDCTQDIDECRESGSPCEHGGTCVNTPGSFRCDCSNGFAGPRCEVNINECDSSPCLNDGTCLDERGQFKCVCMPGYSGLHCEHDIDECASNPCLNDAICTDLIAGFRCLCPPGFDGTRCERNLDDCSSQPCLNGGTCSDEVSTFSCTCALGFTGRTCESNIDDCESSPCHHGSCRDGHNSFTCQCAPGYTGLLCQSKINECLSSPCLNGGKCSDHDNGYTCQCVTGVTGANCEYNVNECWSNPCRNGGTCRDLIGQYQCDCVHGYSGVNCEHDIDECASSPCANGGTCSQSRSHPNGYRCMCPHGFYGTRCLASTDECASNPCLNGGTCDDDVNRFVCYCARGFTGSRCESEVNECTRVTDTCLNGGTCLDRRRGSYECLCFFGFTGNRCEANINDCHDNPCRNGGTCRDLIGQYRCECTRGYEGTNCEQEVDECASNPCANTGTCVQTHFGYRCLCAHGFYGTRCLSKVDECASNPCLNGGTCDDDINQFVCHCLRGFTGTRCETNVNECAHVTCMNGGTCLDGIDTYTCVCSRGFVGRHCETRDSTSSNADDPWNKCALAHHCRSRFGDLKCDEECNSRECLFDGTDCRPAARGAGEHACNELYDAYCARNFANGHCDFGCNNAECAWDGLDCEARNTGGSGRSDDPKQHNDFVLRDALIIVVDAPPSLLTAHTAEAKHALSSLLRDLSTFIGSVVTLREMRANGSHATQLVLVVDNRRCANNQCFDTTRDIAHFLSASQTRMTIAPGFRITSADAEDSSSLDTPTHTPPQPHGLTYVAVSVVVLLVGGALLGVLVTTSRKKVARGITWFPEGFFTNQMTRESSREAARNNASAHAANGEYGRTRRRNAMNMNGGARTGRPDGQEMRAFKSHDELVCDDKSACAIYEEPMECRAWSHAHYEAYGSDSMTPPLSTPSIDALGPNGMTPLMVASAFPHHAITIDNPDTCNDSNNAVHDLLMSGANVSLACERTHETSLHLAARYARADAAKRLLEGGADCNATDATGRTPLHTAIASDARGVFEILLRNRSTNLNARANDGTTPLILCARLANEGMLDQLVLSECDLNACDDCGKTALHWAASVNNCDAVRVLLQNGANRDAQNAREETPLFLAAREGAFQCAKLLLECHANRDITDHMDRLPRDVALERMHTDIVALLDEFVPPPPQTNQSNQNSNQNPISPQQQSQTRQSTASLQRRKANSRVNGSAVGGVNSNVPPIPPPRDTKPLTLTRDNTRVTFNEICSPPSRPPPAYEECVNKSLQSTRVTNNGMSSHVVVLPQWNHSQPRPPESYLTPSPDSPGTWSSPSTSSPASVVTAHDWLPVCSSGADNNSVTAQSQSNRYLNGMSLNGQTMTSPQQQQSQQHHSHISSTQTAVFI